MPDESRLLGKQIIPGDGFAQRPDLSGPAVFFEGGNIVAKAPLKINDGDAISLWSTIATLNFGAMAPTGTATAVASADVAMSGVAIGDWVSAVPISSLPAKVFWSATCISAANVHVRAMQNGSGDFDPGETTFRIIAIKVA